jgi:hypothetical protein
MKNRKGISKLKGLFWYSDSEPNEILIAFCHLIALPAALCVEFNNPSILLITMAVSSGLFQMWAVLWSEGLNMRLIAVQIATLIALGTVFNLSMEGLLNGSRLGWVIIAMFAIWNTIRVFREKLEKSI